MIKFQQNNFTIVRLSSLWPHRKGRLFLSENVFLSVSKVQLLHPPDNQAHESWFPNQKAIGPFE